MFIVYFNFYKRVEKQKMPWFTYDLIKNKFFKNPNNTEITLLSVICIYTVIKFKKINIDIILFIDFDKLVEEPISQLKKLK